MAATVVVQNLRKQYGPIQAVRDVSFEVGEGEVVGLLGRNGAGKTSTIECMIGLRRPDAGNVRVCGVDALADAHRVRQLIGVQLQATALQAKITPREAIGLFASFYESPADVDDLVNRFGLREKQHSAFDALSGGQRQRLALALAFVNQPKVLFLDEPTSRLDPQARRELHESIRQMRSEQRTVLLTTHYIEEAHELCDRVAIIDQGRLIAIGTPDELIARSSHASLIQLRVARPMDVAQVRSIPGVQGLVWNDDHGSFRTNTMGDTMRELLNLLDTLAVELVDLQLRKPTLEDVFIELIETAPSN